MDASAIILFNKKAYEKEKKGQCRIFLWDILKKNLPAAFKCSPLSAAVHRSKAWCAILDLAFFLQLKSGKLGPSVNLTSSQTAPYGAIDQMGHAFARLIHAFAHADPALCIFLAKWDIKDSFWRLVCHYVLPQLAGEPTRIVAPNSLQMGWIECPGYFTATSKTGRDIAAQPTETPVGSLPQHKFLKETQTDLAYAALPKSSGGSGYD